MHKGIFFHVPFIAILMPQEEYCHFVYVGIESVTFRIFVSMETIRNKVKESGLIQLDLSQLLDHTLVKEIDLKNQLWQGFVLKEKDFRLWIKSHPWEEYKGSVVHLFCSTEAIIPTWAYMLVTSALSPFTRFVVTGTARDVEHVLVKIALESLDLQAMKGQRVIVKGCAHLLDQETALSQMVLTLQPVVKSLMFGESCSTVPIFKR